MHGHLSYVLNTEILDEEAESKPSEDVVGPNFLITFTYGDYRAYKTVHVDKWTDDLMILSQMLLPPTTVLIIVLAMDDRSHHPS